MTNYIVSDTQLTAIADAIRSKREIEDLLEFPDEFTSAIDDIEIGDIFDTISSSQAISITNAAAAPLTNLVVNFEPVQDLHGYSKPWVGGYGKNLMSSTIGRYNWAEGIRYENTTVYCATEEAIDVSSNQTYTLSFQNSGTTSSVYFAWFNGDTFLQNDSLYNAPWTVTSPNNATKLAITFRNADEYSGDPTVSNVMFEKGETASSWEPYSNVCPIISKFRQNLFDKSIVTAAGEYQVQLKPYTQYTMSTTHPATSSSTAYVIFKLNGEEDSSVNNGVWINHPHTLTTGSDGIAIVKCILLLEETLSTFLTYDYKIEEGDSVANFVFSQTEKNFLPMFSNTEDKSIVISVAEDGTITANGTASADTNQIIVPINVTIPAGVPYTISAFNPIAQANSAGQTKITLFIRNDTTGVNNAQVNLDTINATKVVEAQTVDTHIVDASLRFPSGFVAEDFVIKPMLTIGTELPTAYVPYQSINKITVSDPPTTVYKGTLDLLSGILTVTHVKWSPDPTVTPTGITDITKNGVSTGYTRCAYSAAAVRPPITAKSFSGDGSNMGWYSHGTYTNPYNEGSSHGYVSPSGPGYFWFPCAASGDAVKAFVASQITAGTPIELVYEIAEPIKYQLTPQQITMLQGNNTILSSHKITLTYLNLHGNNLINTIGFVEGGAY